MANRTRKIVRPGSWVLSAALLASLFGCGGSGSGVGSDVRNPVPPPTQDPPDQGFLPPPDGGIVGSVPTVRLQVLAEGINLAHWFQLGADQRDPTRLPISQNDLDLLWRAGFNHVRLPLEPDYVIDMRNPTRVRRPNMDEYLAAIRTLLASGLGVIVDVHIGDQAFLRALTRDPVTAQRFKTMWDTLSRELARTDPNQVFFEVLNELGVENPAGWWKLQGQVLEIIRANAPEHTIIVGPDNYAEPERLVGMQPYRDGNVVYKVHFYGPSTFTHQGAPWIGAGYELLSDVPYPLDANTVKRVKFSGMSFAWSQMMQEAREGWNAAKIRSFFDAVGAWARHYGVNVILNEFGVRRDGPRAAERQAWFRDVITACRANGIGWTMWEYAGDFGIARWGDDPRSLDPGLLQALSLRPGSN